MASTAAYSLSSLYAHAAPPHTRGNLPISPPSESGLVVTYFDPQNEAEVPLEVSDLALQRTSSFHFYCPRTQLPGQGSPYPGAERANGGPGAPANSQHQAAGVSEVLGLPA